MFHLLWLILILPFLAFLLLVLLGGRLSRRATAILGISAVGLSALLTLLLGINFLLAPPAGVEERYTQTLWTLLRVGAFAPRVTLSLDALSLVMLLVVTIISFLILLYSVGYMAEQEGYARFFAYMNLFVGSMLLLVLADNLLLLYFGWEGVGLCSYLLIGFWYTDPANVRAAMKAFIITRIGDVSLAIALFLLFTRLGTLQIQEVMVLASRHWPVGSSLAVLAAALLLGGAVGKSAQLPLQTWLPDAMAGPTPVSALIHAATMVTAGVYLIARTHTLFSLAPPVELLVAVIGVLTLLIGAFSALAQHDLKRILAYSTMSQIGYMFLALGVGAWSAAIFHLVTHACFKALLFLAAGVVILNVHDDHDIFHMGGLARKMPLVFWTFLIGALALAAFPLLTAGFYSKDLIIEDAWASAYGSHWLWAGAWLGAFVTALYTYRMVFLVFFGPEHTAPAVRQDAVMNIPLLVLALFTLCAGLLELPQLLVKHPLFSAFLQPMLRDAALTHGGSSMELLLMDLSIAASLGGLLLAYLLYLRRPVEQRSTPLSRVLLAGFGFDLLYTQVFVRPYLWFARVNKHDVIDIFYWALAHMGIAYHQLLSSLQTGKVRWYAMGVAIGALIIIAILELL